MTGKRRRKSQRLISNLHFTLWCNTQWSWRTLRLCHEKICLLVAAGEWTQCWQLVLILVLWNLEAIFLKTSHSCLVACFLALQQVMYFCTLCYILRACLCWTQLLFLLQEQADDGSGFYQTSWCRNDPTCFSSTEIHIISCSFNSLKLSN